VTLLIQGNRRKAVATILRSVSSLQSPYSSWHTMLEIKNSAQHITQAQDRQKLLEHTVEVQAGSPSTVRVAIATVKFRVPGIVARQTYTPACCTFTLEIMRFPFPRTRVLKTSMDLWSIWESGRSAVTKLFNVSKWVI